jgi:hypothetical protein
MILSEFLNDVAQQQGADALHGAMVFAMLKRPLDELIAQALALGPYHRGKPSPWSHCFLLAEPYRGAQTAILDCTIRDAQGKVAWDTSLKETLEILGAAASPKGAGGIYSATVGDYDDAVRVTAFGVRWLPGLAVDQRTAIVTTGQGFQKQGYAYDLPGLVRELVRLLVGVTLPPTDKRLFCSAFLQACYRLALGNVGDFNPGLVDADTTQDDIWYSPKGLGIANTNPQSGASSPAMTSFFSKLTAQAPPPPVNPATSDLGATSKEIQRVLDLVRGKPDLPNADVVKGVLERALAQLDLAGQEKLNGADATTNSDDFDLSLVQSAIAAPKDPTRLRSLFGRDIYGIHQYEQLDPAWIASLANDLTHSAVPFPVASNFRDVVYTIPETATIAIAGDWGTGNNSSKAIAAQIQKLGPDYTIHLGDVYYSGTESEEQQRFVDLWPKGKLGSLALNSNHEMYSGGRGYFGVALPNEKFRMQKGYSYFALTNSEWLVIGLDSAYTATSMYQNGALNDAQMQWLKNLLASEVARVGGELKNIIVLTHHQGLEMADGRHVEPLFSQVTGALGQVPNRWYWGHVHGVAAFNPIKPGDIEMHARLVGHGGIPYALDPLTPPLAWTENQTAGDATIPERGRNGFALMQFTDDGLQETLYDEFGNSRWSWP